jgi:hypothetical protein
MYLNINQVIQVRKKQEAPMKNDSRGFHLKTEPPENKDC